MLAETSANIIKSDESIVPSGIHVGNITSAIFEYGYIVGRGVHVVIDSAPQGTMTIIRSLLLVNMYSPIELVKYAPPSLVRDQEVDGTLRVVHDVVMCLSVN